MPEIAKVQDMQQALNQQANYVCGLELSTTLFLAEKMEKPVLLEGPAGVGKTEVAKALAKVFETDLIRMQCYEGLDESRALYEWEYSKQLLYTQLLRGKIDERIAEAASMEQAVETLGQEESVFFSEHFLLERPLLAAIRAPKRVVLLIDEIDKADAEFEAFLLELLSDFQITIPELGTMKANIRPLVILTSNQARELSEALKRRCLYHYIDYPSREIELEIIHKHLPTLDQQLGSQIVDVIQSVRELDVRKKPSISETIEWAQALVLTGAKHIDADVVRETLGTFLKHKNDQKKVSEQADSILSETL